MPRLSTRSTSEMKPRSRLASGIHDPATAKTYFCRHREDDLLLIGRHRSCDIHLADRRVSHQHAVIKFMPDGRVILRDSRSRNGTYINGERIEKPVTLLTGMQIYLGGHGLLIATDSAGEFPIEAYNIPQFCHFALELYGNQRLAREHVGKSRKFLTNHADKWKKGRDWLRGFFQVTH